MGELEIKHNNTWKKPDMLYVKHGGVWKEVEETYVRHNNVWQSIFVGTILNLNFTFDNETLDAQSSSLLGVWELGEQETDATGAFWRNKANGFTPSPDYQRLRIGFNNGGPVEVYENDSPTKDDSSSTDDEKIVTVVLNSTSQFAEKPLDGTDWGSKKLGAISFWFQVSEQATYTGSSSNNTVTVRTTYSNLDEKVSMLQLGHNDSYSAKPMILKMDDTTSPIGTLNNSDEYGADSGSILMTKGWHKICIIYRPDAGLTNSEGDPSYRLYIDGVYQMPTVRDSVASIYFFDIKYFEISFGVSGINKTSRLSQICLWEQLTIDSIVDLDTFATADYNNGLGNKYAIHAYENKFGRTSVDAESDNLLAVYDFTKITQTGSGNFWTNRVRGTTEDDNLYIRQDSDQPTSENVETPWFSTGAGAGVPAGSAKSILQIGQTTTSNGTWLPSDWAGEEVGAFSIWMYLPPTGVIDKSVSNRVLSLQWNYDGGTSYGSIEFGHNNSGVIEHISQAIGEYTDASGYGDTSQRSLTGWTHFFVARVDDAIPGNHRFKIYIDGVEVVQATAGNTPVAGMYTLDNIVLSMVRQSSNNQPYNFSQFCIWKKLTNGSASAIDAFVTDMYNKGRGLNYNVRGNEYEGVNPRNVDGVSAYYTPDIAYVDNNNGDIISWFDVKENDVNTLTTAQFPSTVGTPSISGDIVTFSNNILAPETSLSVDEVWVVVDHTTGVWRQSGGAHNDITPLLGQDVGAGSVCEYTFLSNTAGYTVHMGGTSAMNNGNLSIDQGAVSGTSHYIIYPGYPNYPSTQETHVVRIKYVDHPAITDVIGGFNFGNNAHTAHDLKIKDIVFAEQSVSQEVSDGIVEYLMKKNNIPYTE